MPQAPLRESLSEHAFPSGGMRPDGVWPTLLVVDGDEEMLQTLVYHFELRGYHVAAVTTLAEAKAHLQRRQVWTLILADYHLPDGTGWELCCWLREQARATPFLLMSGSAQAATLCAGTDFLAKPFPLEQLENRLRALLGR